MRVVEQEVERQVGRKESMLSDLIKAGDKGLTNIQLSKKNIRYGGYLGMLYKEGHRIDTIPLGDGVYLYKYISSPKEPIIRESAIDKLKKAIDERGLVSSDTIEEVLEEINASVRYKPNTYKK